MKKLDGSICYLAGAIDFSPDQGCSWRRSLIEKCNTQHGLGIKFLDPTNKLDGLKHEVGAEQDTIKKMKKNGEWEQLRDFMKTIVRHDHRCVDISDFIIVYIDVKCHTCGTYFELQSALSQKKPYFIIIDGGKKNTPSWLFGILDHKFIYDDIDSVVAQLNMISNGESPLNDRWVLIRNQLKGL